MLKKKRWIIVGTLLLLMGMCSIPEIRHVNQGTSTSTGTVREGKLINGWLIPYKGNNFQYFSFLSYYILDNAYVNSKVYHVVMDAYKTCESTCPGVRFTLMECTRKKGGRMIFHWTHQNGKSVDFMVPKLRGNDKVVRLNQIGLPHYLLAFDEEGRFALSKKTRIDFESMARHLLAIDGAAKKHGIGIRKILFHTDLHDELFSTPSGKLLKERNIRFIPHLNDLINELHDDHYHIDFDFD